MWKFTFKPSQVQRSGPCDQRLRAQGSLRRPRQGLNTLNLPDAIVTATAIHLGIQWITADKSLAELKPEFEVVMYAK